jgi:hypothetical protein
LTAQRGERIGKERYHAALRELLIKNPEHLTAKLAMERRGMEAQNTAVKAAR